MNDEIKEILDFKENADYKKLSCDEIAILKDYIINLQQKIKHYEETTTFGDYVKEVNLLVYYKSRIDKAIKFIDIYTQTAICLDTDYDINMEVVKDILKGDKNE